MTMNHIIDEIWKLPWDEVLFIAIYDRYILLYKIWPFFLFCSIVIILVMAKKG